MPERLADCSTGPEVRIFDHLWRNKEMLESDPPPKASRRSGVWSLTQVRMCSMSTVGVMLNMRSDKGLRRRMSC